MGSSNFDALVAIAVIVAAARIIGSGAVRLGQPRIVGEIVAGLLLGPTLLGSWSTTMVPSDARPMLSAVGDVGLTLFMLVVAISIDWGRLSGRLGSVAIVSTLSVSVPAAGGAVAALWWWNAGHVPGFGTDAAPSPASFAVLVATAASVTALPVAAKILAERGQLGDDVGRVGLSVAAVSTAVMFVGLGVGVDLVEGFDAGVLVGRLVGLLVLGAGAVLAVRVLAVGVRWHVSRSGTGWRPDRAGVVGVAVAAALGGGAVTDRMGLHAMIGGFLVGVVLERGVSSAVQGRGRDGVDVVRRPIVESVGPVVDVVLLPVFLAVAGLRTDLREATTGVLATAIGLLAIAVIGRWSGAYLGSRLAGLPPRSAQTIAGLLNCRGLLILVVGLAAADAGVFTQQLQIAGVVVALVTTAMTGPLLRRADAGTGGHAAQTADGPGRVVGSLRSRRSTPR